jgi:hypothetical protein
MLGEQIAELIGQVVGQTILNAVVKSIEDERIKLTMSSYYRGTLPIDMPKP